MSCSVFAPPQPQSRTAALYRFPLSVIAVGEPSRAKNVSCLAFIAPRNRDVILNLSNFPRFLKQAECRNLKTSQIRARTCVIACPRYSINLRANARIFYFLPLNFRALGTSPFVSTKFLSKREETLSNWIVSRAN